ncbi:nucleoside hydrolase [Devosia sp. CN2-171]|uniref:nucleoside hydrolase n=1 Tax=Devosia sp. CN2-171 TaxID=3400909 RepID=UPI003BF82613
MRRARRVIIDTDPGLDDAVAILFALSCGRFEIVGLTTVAGNIGIETTTRNAGRLLALMGRADVPVVAGASAPLRRGGIEERAIHGDDGLGGVMLPAPQASPLEGAAAWMAKVLTEGAAHSIDVLALGPLTNIARLVLDHPEAAGRIGRLIVMGGAIDEPGNVGPRSEFNLACDPEAADIVLRAGLDTTLIPLDVTRKVRAGRDWLSALRASGGRAAGTCADLIEAYFASSGGRESRPLHDPCVMLFALQPALFAIDTRDVSVELGAGADAGALLTGRQDGVALRVALRVDAAGALRLLADGLR